MSSDSKKDLYQVLADESFMGILAIRETDLKCVYMNKLAYQLLEVPPETSPEDFDWRSMVPDSAHTEIKSFSEELIHTESFHQEVMISKADNMRFIAAVGLKSARLEEEKLNIVMFEDVTYEKKLQRDLKLKQEEIKKAYEDILAQNDQLKELDRAKDKFIALTTHELRTPLSAMVATADVLVHGLYDGEEMLQEYIATIHEQGMHMVALVNDILDFAKIQAGKMEYFVEDLDVVDLVKTQVKEFQQMAEGKEIQMNLQEPDMEMNAYFDRMRVTQVISNVLSNSIKYNNVGGKVDVTLKTVGEGNLVRISIQDTGPGIPEDKLQSVFNEFETIGRVDNHHKGTGLGLPIARRLMNEIGGQIHVESTVGEGSCFMIDIPKDKVLAEEYYRSRPDFNDDLVA